MRATLDLDENLLEQVIEATGEKIENQSGKHSDGGRRTATAYQSSAITGGKTRSEFRRLVWIQAYGA